MISPYNRMAKKGVIFIIGILLVGAIAVAFFLAQNGMFSQFDAEGRYDSSHLNTMGVVYEDQSNITAFNEGYSTTDTCPWGFAHDGIDYFFANDSEVIAAAPGLVTQVKSKDYGSEVENQYHILIEIQYNATTYVSYNFEPWTQDEADKEHQEQLFAVSEGEWVQKGDQIATFLAIGSGAHIHFDIREDGNKPCPTKYFDTAGYSEIMDLIHSFHPTWNLCYT